MCFFIWAGGGGEERGGILVVQSKNVLTSFLETKILFDRLVSTAGLLCKLVDRILNSFNFISHTIFLADTNDKKRIS